MEGRENNKSVIGGGGGGGGGKATEKQGSLNGGGEKVKNYISSEVDQFKENAVPSKCRQFLATFAKHFVPQNGFNSSRSPQMK